MDRTKVSRLESRYWLDKLDKASQQLLPMLKRARRQSQKEGRERETILHRR